MATRADVLTIVVLVAGVSALAPVALHGQERKASQNLCANNLRQLGLAAIQYADDKRFLPHVGKTQDLDGGYTTNASPKITRTLVWFGYHDAPEGFVCPSSPDRALPIEDKNVKANLRLWFWGGESTPASPTVNPFVDTAPDPALSTTTELSYGWTRRGMNANARTATELAADRARANHGDGWNVLQLNATVAWVGDPAAQATLIATTTEPTSGFLGIQGPDDPAPPGR
jgi:hypothetical protein